MKAHVSGWKERVARRLKERRLSYDWSQSMLAKEAGVSQEQISHIEIGRRMPSLETFFKLCFALNIRPASVFELKGE